jgi:hypothetical protein
MRRAPPIAVVVAMLPAALLAARAAGAYCQSATCPSHGSNDSTQGQVCDPPQSTDCGQTLQWRQPCVSFDVQMGASKQVDYATADKVLTQAFATWTGVDCNGGTPSLQIFDFGPVACDDTEYNQDSGNANILIFRDEAWPHDTGGGGVDTLALTTVTYDVDTADIYDADIEVNTADNTFTTSDTPGPDDVDLLAVLTHEAGHFTGLAHTAVMPATMFPSYTDGTIGIRTLQPDDEAAICAAYPVDRQPTGACTGIPRHGWSPVCAAQQSYASCSASSGRSSPREGGGGALAASLALAAVALSRGGRKRPQTPRSCGALTNRRGSRRS